MNTETSAQEPRATTTDQLALDEKVIEDDEIEEALEEREKRKAAKNAVTTKYREAHEHAVGLINSLGISEDQVVRVGRFRLTKSQVSGRQVAFETAPTERLLITADSDDRP